MDGTTQSIKMSTVCHFLCALEFGFVTPTFIEFLALKGSKRHITNQCVYFAFKTIVLLGYFFPKKHVFIKRNFQMKYFETFYLFYL